MASEDQYELLTPHKGPAHSAIYLGLVIDDILDEHFLQEKAEELLRRWPLVGGKIIQKSQPFAAFAITKSGPLDFASRRLEQDMQSVLPMDISYTPSSDKPEYRPIRRGSSMEKIFLWGGAILPSAPPPDRLLTIRVTILKDATLLGVKTSHFFTDMQSMYDIVHAYANLVNGKSIPELILPPDVDTPLSELVIGEDEIPPSANISANGLPDPSELCPVGVWLLIRVAVAIFWTALLRKIGISDQIQFKFIHLSGEFVNNLQASSQAEVKKAAAEGELMHGEGLELSRNDVILAWFLKKYAINSPFVAEPIRLQFAFDYRRLLQPQKANTTFLHDTVIDVFANVGELHEIQSEPLWKTALKLRIWITQIKQPSAVRRTLKYYESIRNEVIPPGPRDSTFINTIISTCYTTTPFCSEDFSGALVQKRSSRTSSSGRVKFVYPHFASPLSIMPFPYVAILKDGKGGYWVKGILKKHVWKGFEED